MSMNDELIDVSMATCQGHQAGAYTVRCLELFFSSLNLFLLYVI